MSQVMFSAEAMTKAFSTAILAGGSLTAFNITALMTVEDGVGAP